MKNLGIRARITLLVLSVSLPALALAVYGSFSDRAVAESHARAGLKMRAALTARELAQIVEGARQTLVAVSQFLPALHLDQRACNEYFANLLAKSSGLYHSMGLFSAQGELFCNGVPWQGKVSVSDRLYFQRAVSTRAFSVGEYQFGRVTRRHGINFGYPVIDGQGKVTAVALIALGTITASFGVAVFPDHAEDADKLLRTADECLYRAKNAGRDRVVVSSLAQAKAA